MDQPVVALLLTISLEYLVYLAMLRKDPGKLLLYAALVSTATEPLALFTYQNILSDFWTIEAAVVLVESLLIWKLFPLPYRRALLLSLLANGFSALVGVLIYFL